jgi:DNA polymerase III epsilon subunit-like protein
MIVVDVEASGTNYSKHSLVSIGALALEKPESRFYQECSIWDGAHVMDDALHVNGFTRAQITDPGKPTEADTLQAFLEWTQHFSDRTLVGQNVSFDRDMLQAAAQRAGQAWDLAYRTLDTHTMCWFHMVRSGHKPPIDTQHRRSSLNLDAILNYCGIPAEPSPHNALTGALCHAEVTARLMYDTPLLPEFQEHPVPWQS